MLTNHFTTSTTYIKYFLDVSLKTAKLVSTSFNNFLYKTDEKTTPMDELPSPFSLSEDEVLSPLVTTLLPVILKNLNIETDNGTVDADEVTLTETPKSDFLPNQFHFFYNDNESIVLTDEDSCINISLLSMRNSLY